jgi:hypothetical protein
MENAAVVEDSLTTCLSLQLDFVNGLCLWEGESAIEAVSPPFSVVSNTGPDSEPALAPDTWQLEGVRKSLNKQKWFTQRRQGAKPRKGQILCFLCIWFDLAPLREIVYLFHTLQRPFLISCLPLSSTEGHMCYSAVYGAECAGAA